MTSHRFRLLAFALLVVLSLAPAAGARPLCEGSPDACDLNAAARAHQHVHRSAQSPAPATSSSSATLHRTTDGGAPWLDIGLGVGSAFAIAGAVGLAVRSRQRVARVRVS